LAIVQRAFGHVATPRASLSVSADGDTSKPVNDREAEIVRRIFREYADGKGSLAIVAGLNHDGISGPRGGRWNASALIGSPKRRNGLLNSAF
jgi:site-specific DNA recombinase